MIITIHIDTESTEHLRANTYEELSRVMDYLESVFDAIPERIVTPGTALYLYDSYNDLCGWISVTE